MTHSQVTPTGEEWEDCDWYPAEGPISFSGPLFGPTGQPDIDDVHQGVLGDCYFAAALILTAKYNPAEIMAAIMEVSPAGKGSAKAARVFHVTLKHYERGSPPCELVTIEVNDRFYVQGLASNLAFTGNKTPAADIKAKDFDDDSCKDWGKTRLDRMKHLANLRGVRETGNVLKNLQSGPKALYINTGERNKCLREHMAAALGVAICPLTAHLPRRSYTVVY